MSVNKAEKKPVRARCPEVDDSEQAKAMTQTQELFKQVSSSLDELGPQSFEQISVLIIDTEERLKGVIDLIYEKAISESDYSDDYANMCRCLMAHKVPMQDKRGTVSFHKVLLNRCQVELEKDKMDDYKIFEKELKELEGASSEEMRQLTKKLRDNIDKARRRSLGNIKFIGELFKLKMLTEVIMHDCIVKLIKNEDEESLECLCRLLSTVGKVLDHKKDKPRMDQHFSQIEKIVQEGKTTFRTHFKLQEVLDLRRNNWVLLALGDNDTRGSLGKRRRSDSTSSKPVCVCAGKRARKSPSQRTTIREYLHSKNLKEALNSTQLLFVQNGLKLTLECNTVARKNMGLLLHQLLKTGTLSTKQYYKGLQEILEAADNMAIDVPHIWRYLAELITPMLRAGGIPMGELFREISKPLVPLGKAGVLLVHILTLRCKGMSCWRVGRMWREAGLQWEDFVPEDVDVDKFVTEQNVEFTLSSESETSESEELSSSESDE